MSITLFIGPMFAGKTSALIACYEEGITIVYKHQTDQRYSVDRVQSHDGISIPAIAVSMLPLSFAGTTGAECQRILIDEGQFFPNLVEACTFYAWHGKDVCVSALSGTSERKPWPVVSELIPHCDRIDHFCARLCMRCRKKKAPFTAVRNQCAKTSVVQVGGAELYEPVCRECSCFSTAI